MKLLFKQRFFSWFDSYDIYDENGNTAFTVEGKFGWGHKLHILDPAGNHIATVQEKVLRFLPTFEFSVGGRLVGTLRKQFRLLTQVYDLNCNGWRVEGNFLGWDYAILDASGRQVARVSKELFRFTDTYVIDVHDPNDALTALMITLAIDAEKCSDGNN